MTGVSASFMKGEFAATGRNEIPSVDGERSLHSKARETRTRWIRTGAELAALGPVWDGLLDRCEIITPFMRWDWIWRWWQAHEESVQLALCVAEEMGEVVAVAPFVIGREDKGSRRGLRQLSLMAGIGEAQGERMNLMIPVERVHDLAPLLLGRLLELNGQWDAMRLNRLPAESAVLPLLQEELERLTTGFGVLNRTPCRFLNLDFPVWEDVIASRSRKWRAQYRKIKAQLPEQYGVTFHTGSESPTGEDAVEALFRLHAQQFQGQDSHFLRERALKVHRELIPLWQQAGRSELCYLVSGGKIVSMVHLLREGTQVFAFQVGRDPSFPGRSVGTAAWDWAMEHAYRTGAKSVDFLAGDFEYKRRWTEETRTVLDLEGYAPWSWRARVFLFLRRFRRGLKRKDLVPEVVPEEGEA